jgi:hypothetical protein
MAEEEEEKTIKFTFSTPSIKKEKIDLKYTQIIGELRTNPNKYDLFVLAQGIYLESVRLYPGNEKQMSKSLLLAWDHEKSDGDPIYNTNAMRKWITDTILGMEHVDFLHECPGSENSWRTWAFGRSNSDPAPMILCLWYQTALHYKQQYETNWQVERGKRKCPKTVGVGDDAISIEPTFGDKDGGLGGCDRSNRKTVAFRGCCISETTKKKQTVLALTAVNAFASAGKKRRSRLNSVSTARRRQTRIRQKKRENVRWVQSISTLQATHQRRDKEAARSEKLRKLQKKNIVAVFGNYTFINFDNAYNRSIGFTVPPRERWYDSLH